MTMQAIQDLQASIKEFRDNVLSRVEELENRAARPRMGGGGPGSSELREELGELRNYLRTGRATNLSVGDDSAGGYLVGTAVSEMIDGVLRDVSPLRTLITPIVLTEGDAYDEIFEDLDTMDAGWVGETQTRPETNEPSFHVISTPLREIYAQPKATQKLIDLASWDVDAWLREAIGTVIGEREGTAFISGAHPLRPQGILTYEFSTAGDSSRDYSKLQYVPSGETYVQGSAGLTADGFIDLATSLRAPYRPGARYMMNRATAGATMKLKDGNGQYIWQKGFQEGQPPLLCGFPVTLCEDMPDVGADAHPVVFGNFQRGYRIVDHKNGLTILRDPYTSKGNVKFYATRRTGGGVRDFDAIKVMKIAAS